MNHVIVTGGASGIGAATASLLADRGARVSIVDRTPLAASTDSVAAWWAGLPDALRGTWSVADAADPGAMTAAIEAVAADPIDGLVCCAGLSIKELFVDSSDQAWVDTMAVNVIGTAVACRTAARRMISAGSGGAIVAVSSTVASGSVAGLGAHYHASKGAISALTRALAAELGASGIRVNAVAPGLVRTPMTRFMRSLQGEDALTARVPLHAIAEPSDVAEAIAFLLSADAEMITGHVLPVDAGQLMVTGAPIGGFPPVSTRSRSDRT